MRRRGGAEAGSRKQAERPRRPWQETPASWVTFRSPLPCSSRPRPACPAGPSGPAQALGEGCGARLGGDVGRRPALFVSQRRICPVFDQQLRGRDV
jgi:hypothetical protein